MSTIYVCNGCLRRCRAYQMTGDLMYCKVSQCCQNQRQREPYPTKVKTIKGKACKNCARTFDQTDITKCASFSCPLWVCEDCAYKDVNNDWCCCHRHGLREDYVYTCESVCRCTVRMPLSSLFNHLIN